MKTTLIHTASDAALKERIRQGALHAFQARGIRSVSTSDLARELGISKSTLYAHYPTKESLVREVLLGILDQVWKEASAAMKTARSSRTALQRYFGTVARHNAAYPPGAIHDVAREYPALAAEFQQARAEHLSKLSVYLEQAQAKGELRPGLDVPTVMRVFQALVETLASPEFQTRTGLTPQTVPLYMGFLVDGLYAQGEKP